ncbi:MAG: hypothetical protein UX04_C0002G0260 [Microgenomates group bacterium GW2011_GWF2_45_18]|nr:MAG: hypothetical protein UW18_C0003G0302 [Microgenomates group bacterium GW2011_GWF1_44_10]KKU02117.1 MAG: hypothetical protein UX04_C0002G0260 [Microgenomates group bacterium GW2011_GWF2_45_18]
MRSRDVKTTVCTIPDGATVARLAVNEMVRGSNPRRGAVTNRNNH